MKAMALDVGEKRIGVAVTDPSMMFAQPLAVIQRKNLTYNLKHIFTMVKDNKIDVLVFGLPLNDDGVPTPQAKRILELKEKTEGYFKHNHVDNVRFETFDETMTTRDAHEEMKDAGVKHSQRKTVIDKMAAAVILESWMESKKCEK